MACVPQGTGSPHKANQPNHDDCPATPTELCGVCWRQYRDPRLLHCLHTACRECIDDKLSETDEIGTVKFVKCPYKRCQTVSPLTEEGAAGLPKFFLAAAEADSGDDVEADFPFCCFLCDTGEAGERGSSASFWCDACNAAFCRTHVTAHIAGQPAGESHPISALENASSSDVLQRKKVLTAEKNALECGVHKCTCRLHCGACDAAICSECREVGDHYGHAPIRPLSEILEPRKSRVAEQVETLTSRTVPQLESCLQAVDSVHRQVEHRAHEVLSSIQEAGERAVKAVQAYVEEMRQEVEDMKHARLTVLDQQRDELKRHIQGALNAISFSQRIFQLSHFGGAVFSLLRALDARVAGLLSAKVPEQPQHHSRMVFHPASTDAVESAPKKTVGEIVPCQASAKRSVIEGELTRTLLHAETVRITVRLNDAHGNALKMGGDIINVKISGPGELPVDVEDHCNGEYSIVCGGVPSGTYRLEVQINGEQMVDEICLTYISHELHWDAAESHPKIVISRDGQRASLRENANKHCSVLGNKAMRSGIHTWTVRIGSNASFQTLGVAMKPLSSQRYDDYKRVAYCMHSTGYCSCRDGIEWENVRLSWAASDSFLLALDCDSCTLAITNLRSREKRTFSGLLPAEYFPFASMYAQGNSVEFVQ